MKLKLALLAALAAASVNALACYTVYDRNDRIVYNAQRPPVDMSLPLHETLPRVFPGGHMIFAANTECPANVSPAPTARIARAQPRGAASPLLTDESTARAMGLPHTQLASGAAIVPAQAVAWVDLPTFSVIQTSNDLAVASARTLNTTAMGAGPANPALATQTMGAGPASTQDRGAIITELRDPPVTIIQRGRDVIVRQR
jgi:hypothetical protein